MELFAREPTPPTQARITAAATFPPANAPLGFASQSYPSPVHERPPAGVVRQLDTNMAAMVPNGTRALPQGSHSGDVSPRTVTAPKMVEFILVFRESPYQARLPLRVSILPHDDTDSIISTVTMFYGLYSGPGISKGVSFEDQDGNTLIARYENFQNNMRVHVRVIEEPLGPGYPAALGVGQGSYNDNGYLPQGPQHLAAHAPRPEDRTSRLRSASPNRGRERRSTSAGTNPTGSKNGRSRSSKNRTLPNGDGLGDSFNGYSSSDGAAGSSSGRAKDQLGNTDISLENIVEGGRRKRAKFESSVSRHVFRNTQELRVTDRSPPAGTPSLCPSANAGCHVEPLGVARSSDGPAPKFLALHPVRTESF